MGRPNRIQFPGACYYITLQGNNRQDLFLSNQDRRQFLSFLKEYKERYDLLIYAYCLMNHSVDLLVETRRPNLSRAMQGFNTVYTKYFNRAHNTAGHLFQGRYRALLIDKPNYLLEMTSRVHLQPVQAGLKERPWRYLWCSCAAYVESGESERLVDTDPVLRLLGVKNRLKQSVKYLHYIKARIKAGTKKSYPVHAGVIGSPEFIKAMPGHVAVDAEAPGRASSIAQEILAEVLSSNRLDRETLFGRDQWREVASVRKEAVYRLWKEAKMGVTEIGRMFHRTPSAVSQLVRSVEFPRSPSSIN